MKVTNIKQLILNYFSGAKDFIPTKYLKDVKIVGDNEGGSDGGGGGGEDSGSIADKAFKMIRTSNADGILYGGQFYPNDDNIKPIIESLYTYRDNHEDFAILYGDDKWGEYNLLGQNKKFGDSYGDYYYLPIICYTNGQIFADIEMNNIMDLVYTGLYIVSNGKEINGKWYAYLEFKYNEEEYDNVDLSFLDDIVLFTKHYENDDVNITPLSILYGGGDKSNDAILWINSILGKDYSMVRRSHKRLYGTYLKIQNVVTYQQLLDFLNNICTSLGYENYIGQIYNQKIKIKNSDITVINLYNDPGNSGIHIGLASSVNSITLTINKNHPNDLIFTFNNGVDFAYGFDDEDWPDPQYLTRVLIGSNNIDNAYLDNGTTPANGIYAHDSQDERELYYYPVNGHYVGDTYEFDIVGGIINNLTTIVP